MKPGPEKNAKRKQSKAATPKLKHSCGHEHSIKWYESIECPQCRHKSRQKKIEKNRAKFEKSKIGKTPPGRLPHKSVFQVSYDAEREMWSGTLSVGDAVFQAENSAVFKLLSDLDALFRTSLAARDTAA